MAPIDPLRLGLGLFSGTARGVRQPAKAGKRGAAAGGSGGTEAADSDSASGSEPRLPAHILPLAAAVDQAAAELEEAGGGPVLERYRRAVRGFLDAVLHDSMQVSRETTLGLSQRVFASIARSDLLLAELTEAVLGRQRDSAQVRQLTQQLKGLLIDLYR